MNSLPLPLFVVIVASGPGLAYAKSVPTEVSCEPADVLDLDKRTPQQLEALATCTQLLISGASSSPDKTRAKILEDQQKRIQQAQRGGAMVPPPTPNPVASTAEEKRWRELQEAHVQGIVKSINFEDATVAPASGEEKSPALELRDGVQKSVTGGAIASEKLAEVLTIVAEIAVRRARRQGLKFLQARLEKVVCGLKVPPKKEKLALVHTCDLVRVSSLEQLFGAPRPLEIALYQDVLSGLQEQLFAPSSTRITLPASLLQVLEATLSIVARGLSKRDLASNTGDTRVILDLLVAARGIDEASRINWGKAVGVPTGLTAGMLYLDKSGQKHGLPQIVQTLLAEVAKKDPRVKPNENFAIALELANLVVLSHKVTKVDTALDHQEEYLAAMDLAFGCLSEYVRRNRSVDEANDLEQFHQVVHAAVDKDISTALAGGIRLFVTRASTAENQEFERAAAKAITLLTAIASQGAMYPQPKGRDAAKPVDPKVLREQRLQALESMIDATTARDKRHGDWVFSLGIPVGFTVGGLQFTRERERDKLGEVKLDAQGAPENTFRTRPMYPQLALPLGFAAQRLVGRHYRNGKVGDEKTVYFDGIHLFASLIDLGQFLAFDDKGTINLPRWDSFISPGLQVGWMFGTPRNSFILGVEGRYAPTLFSGTTKLKPTTSEDPGGAFRVGVFLVYYIPLFDFN